MLCGMDNIPQNIFEYIPHIQFERGKYMRILCFVGLIIFHKVFLDIPHIQIECGEYLKMFCG